MPFNTFGELFRVTSAGESHGSAMICIIDGCPAGLELSSADIEKELKRRRPGSFYGSRDENDTAEILSGIYNGKTLGSPITVIVRNVNQNSNDYDNLKDIYRPGHADFTWEKKYGIRDFRGGGRSSARETLCRTAAGAVAKKVLTAYRVKIRAWTSFIAGLQMPRPGEEGFDFEEIEINPFRLPCKDKVSKVSEIIEELRDEGDSAGGIVSCLITGAPAGLGEPVFDKLDARLASAMLSIGACKGIEFGAGFAAAAMKGSESNLSHNSGGILGGISTGEDIFFKSAFKPTPSISKPQMAADTEGGTKEIIIKGRHDICLVPRAVPVVEAMAALVLVDFLKLSRALSYI